MTKTSPTGMTNFCQEKFDIWAWPMWFAKASTKCKSVNKLAFGCVRAASLQAIQRFKAECRVLRLVLSYPDEKDVA